MARQLQPGPRQPRAMRRDLRQTLITLVLASLTIAATTVLVVRGAIPLATGPAHPATLIGEVVVYVLLFDAYFYALHRTLHLRPLYRLVHAVHHRSSAPTVLTALAFHPAEAALIIAFMPVTMWLIPIHLSSLAVVSLFLSGSILLAHCGYQLFPDWWERVPVLNWYVTPRVHDAHHARRDCNYSATLSIFDRLFGTMPPHDRHSG